MLNKCLLSLLVLISMTNLFLVNAGVATCLVGTYVVDPTTDELNVDEANYQECSEEQSAGCFQIVEGDNLVFGCGSESVCSRLGCFDKDSCNAPSIHSI